MEPKTSAAFEFAAAECQDCGGHRRRIKRTKGVLQRVKETRGSRRIGFTFSREATSLAKPVRT